MSGGVDAVVFDWGGTLTPWRPMDYLAEARALASSAPVGEVESRAEAILAAGAFIWGRSRDRHLSGTFAELCERASFEPDEVCVQAYRDFWEPSTVTDPAVGPLWRWLRQEGIRVGVLSNTIWPRAWHRAFFRRDGVEQLVDGDVYTSELGWTKPDARAFRAALDAVGVDDPTRAVYVGDRLFEDVWGPARLGIRTIFLPHSTIPDDQLGHSEGTPDAVVQSLSEIPDALAPWR